MVRAHELAQKYSIQDSSRPDTPFPQLTILRSSDGGSGQMVLFVSEFLESVCVVCEYVHLNRYDSPVVHRRVKTFGPTKGQIVNISGFQAIEPLLHPSLTETNWCHFRGSADLWYHSPLCLSVEKNSARGKVIDKSDLLE